MEQKVDFLDFGMKLFKTLLCLYVLKILLVGKIERDIQIILF